MAGMWIKRTSAWSSIQNMWIKTTSGWSPVRSGFIKRSSGWSRFWFKQNLPNQVTAPSIRTTNNSGSGTIYDGPIASSPQILNADLFGKDGTYTNYTSISGRKFTYGDTASATDRTLLVNDDRFTSAGGVTTAMRQSVDEKYLFYELTVSNGNDSINGISSNTVKMIRDLPDALLFEWTDFETVGQTLFINYSISHEYWRRAETSNSKIRWWRSTNTSPGGTLLKEETLASTGTALTNTFDGTGFYTIVSADLGYYIVAELVVVNSWTRHYGYSSGFTLATFPSELISDPPGPLTNLQLYNFSGGNLQGFFSTGIKTTDVKYTFECTSIPSISSGLISMTASANRPYKIEYNALGLFTLKTWNNDTYVSGTTYTKDSLVWYAGNRYQGKDVGFSGFLPTNTTYWTLSSTTANQWNSSTSYSPGNIVWYQGAVYQAGISSTNVAPTVGGDFWYFQYNFANTYNSGTTYFQNNTVNYNGSTYTAKAVSWSGVLPTDTTYWTRIVTVTYNPGDYVLYNSSYYFCKETITGVYPTNTFYWIANSVGFRFTATPYNSTFFGTTSTSPSTSIRADGQAVDPLRISSGPTFSSITSNSFTTNFTPSVYTNRVTINISKNSVSITGYPQGFSVTGGSATTHNSPTNLSPDTDHLVSLDASYRYSYTFSGTTYIVQHNGESSSATARTLPLPPDAFTYSLANGPTITTPPNVTQQRTTVLNDNLVVFDIASSKPADTEAYVVTISGSGSQAYVSNGNTDVTQEISTLNTYNSAGSTTSGAPYTFDSVTGISTSANNSPISIFTRARGPKREITVDTNTKVGANSWEITFEWYGAAANTVTTFSNGVGTARSGTGTLANPIVVTVLTNTLPVKVAEITGSTNPTVYVSTMKAWSGANQTGVSTTSFTGNPNILSNVERPLSAATAVSTANYTYANPPSASGFAITTATATPGTPSSITVVEKNDYSNTADISWSNGSNASAVTVTYSGAGTSGSPFTDTTVPLDTTINRAYTSSGTISVSITNTNNNKVGRVSWNQSNAQSYLATVFVGAIAENFSGNASGSTASFDITVGNTTTQIRLDTLIVYSGLNQTGTATTYTPANITHTPSGVTGSAGTGSGSVTRYVASNPTTFTASQNDSTKITLSYSGGSGSQYGFTWVASDATFRPGDGGGDDYTDTNGSPLEVTNRVRGTRYYWFIRAKYGTGTYTTWFPLTAPGRLGFMPFYPPKTIPTANIIQQARTTTSLSLYWTAPTINAGENFDPATSWDYNLSSSTTTPTTWSNVTTIPTSTSPLVFTSTTAGVALTANTTYYLHVRGKNIDQTGSSNYNTFTTSQQATVTITLNSGTAGRIGATYGITTTGPSVTAYQWQYYNLASDTWINKTNTSSTYTTQYGTSGSASTQDVGRRLRCTVTFSDGQVISSSQITVDNPTITAVLSYYYSTATASPLSTGGAVIRPPRTGVAGGSFVVWYVFGYNFQSMNTKTVIQGTTQTGTTATDSTNINITENTSTGLGIYRQTGVGGNGQTYALRIEPYALVGQTGAIGQRKLTTTLTNNATNQSSSPRTSTTLTDITSL